MAYSQAAINAMYRRVLDCVEAELTDLPAGSEGALAAADLQIQYDIITTKNTSKSSFDGTAQEGTARRSVARLNIIDYMSTLARTAKNIARKKTGFDEHYPAPSGKKDDELLTDARAVSIKAVEDKADFVKSGLDNDFILSGAEFVTEFEDSLEMTNQALSSRGAAVGSKEEAYEKAAEDFDTLDNFVRNFYRYRPDKLNAWRNASRIERSPKKKGGNN